MNKQKKKLYVCYVDFRKTFDSVDRPSMLQKLFQKGVDGNFYDLIKDMYSNTLYSCKFQYTYSKFRS